MKRYLVLEWEWPHCEGGMNDFDSDYDDEDEAIAATKDLAGRGHCAHVWDCDTMRIIWEG